ncbi:MAG: MAPEG family protein [Cyanobacteria bacterium P01_E01_bin.42]
MITAIYAAGLALLFMGLAVRTLRLRGRYQIAIGDGNNAELLRAIRAHANFAEYVPMTLLLIYMLESASDFPILIHALCGILAIGRISHAYGISQVKENPRYRIFGMAMTFTALGGAALAIFAIAILTAFK